MMLDFPVDFCYRGELLGVVGSDARAAHWNEDTMPRHSTPQPAAGISPDGLAACREWLAACLADQEPEPALLLRGFDPSAEAGQSIEHVALWPDGGRATAVAVTFQDAKQRTARLFDLEAFCLMRLLTAFGGSYRFNKDYRKKPYTDERGLHYLTITIPGPPPADNLSLLRIIANAPDGTQVKQLGKRQAGADLEETHYDLRRRNLRLALATPTNDEPYPTKSTKRGRGRAISGAVGTLKSFQRRHGCKRGEPLTQQAYRQLLADASTALDRLPLGPAAEPRAAAE